MDTVFKVCDAMENIAFSASTVVPKSFVCGGPGGAEDGSPDFVISSCGVVTSKYASHDADFGADDNSVCIPTGDEKEKVAKDEEEQQTTSKKEPLHVDVASSDVSEESESTENKASMALFGVPLNWPHVVKKTSSWSSVSHKTASTSYSSYSGSSSSGSSKSKRGDSISMTNKSKKQMERELPSFGKSREYRSFGSNKSQGENSASSLLKPTYMSARQSKQLHEESSRFKYILERTPSGRSSTANECTTTTLQSTAGGLEKESPSSSGNVFETNFLTPFPKLYSS